MNAGELKALRFKPEELEKARVNLRDDLIAKAEKGAIKFEPFTQDIAHGRYDAVLGDDVYAWALAQARAWHGEVIAQMKAAGALTGAGGVVIMRAGWNARVPYARNIPTLEMLKEAGL